MMTLFAIVIVGFGAGKLGYLGGDFNRQLSRLVIAMPVATYGTILCLKYHKDTSLMTETTFITTLLSMVTIPLLVLLFL